MTTKENHNSKRSPKYLFHPFEIVLCGYSGSGKTTLITRLIEKMRARYKIGYVKHDAHRFRMDHEGKDTFKSWMAGAEQVFIFDSEHSATIHRGRPSLIEQRAALSNCDFIFLEGYKNSSSPKIVFIDIEEKILENVREGQIENVVAYVGQKENHLSVEPYFHRDNLDGFIQFVEASLRKRIPALNGLVLTGGKSTRMGSDKALLYYLDKPHGEVVMEMLKPYCENVFLSSRQGQWVNGEFSSCPQIYDRFLDFGPMGGVLSAMKAHPDNAWLVVACDLPHLEPSTLEVLIQNRNPYRFATAFRSQINDLPEPLCAIYEPKSYLRLLEFLGMGYECPRKFLIHSDSILLSLKNEKALENANYVEEFKKISVEIQKARKSAEVQKFEKEARA